jgi:hypothetical protein
MTQPIDLAALAAEAANRFIIDPGNIMVNQYPTTFVYGPSPDGAPILLVTIRNANTTLTIPFPRDQVIAFGEDIAQAGRNLPTESGLTIATRIPVVPGPTMPIPGMNGGRP